MLLKQRWLRWLLQIDRPVPLASQTERDQEIARNYRWNFTVNVADGAFFWFGASFISSATIVPLFISKLTPNPFFIGLVAVIAQGAFYAPQLFTAPIVEKLPRMKPVVVNFGLISERLPLFIMILAAFLAGQNPLLALGLFLFGYAWHYIGAGLIAVAWQDLVARIFPAERRGRYFGTAMFIGAGTGALSASFSAWILDNFLFPRNFVILFTIAAIAIMISWVFIALTRETAIEPEEKPTHTNYWAELPRILRTDANFRNFLTARLILALATLGTGFVAVAAIDRWAVSDGTVGFYTTTLLAGQTVANLVLGFLADRFGHKISLEVAAISGFIAFGLAWLAPGPNYYFVVFFLLGVTFGSTVVSGLLIALEFSKPDKRPTYVGLTNTGVGLVSAIAPLLGASLAGVNYNLLFAIGCLINLFAWFLFRFVVIEPRKLRLYEQAV